MAGEWEPLTARERHYVIHVLHSEGVNARIISDILRVNYRTVTRFLAREDSTTTPESTPQRGGAVTRDPNPPRPRTDGVEWPGERRDALADWATNEALRLATDVHDFDPNDVWLRLAHMPRVELQAVVIALAAIVPTDRTARELLAPIEHLGAA